MPLVTCPDCSKEHSPAATACPSCGRPAQPTVRTIEATGKRYKGVQALGVVLIVVGVVAVIAGGGTFAFVCFATGFTFWILGRFGGWWRHG